ncbi:MAG: hypothetical protein JWO96_656 [Candidatus Saccharibacteria bacterium]|nr:hypothetical protein [Candidatus Saccharibacteria bacterium]
MKNKDIVSLVAVGIVTAIFSFFISGLLFGGSSKTSKVPTAETVSTSFPDIKNDPVYNAIFNTGALDVAQPVQVGNSQNNQPFNGSR